MRGDGGVLGVAAAVVLMGGCGVSQPASESVRSSPTPAPRIGPLTPRDPGRIPAEQAAAIVELAATASPLPPDAHPGHHSHDEPGPQTTVELASTDQRRLNEQWMQARGAVSGLDTIAEATAAGYFRAAVPATGIGSHWVNWMLIDAPFDPARPSMLLFDERGSTPRLVGFSYWLRSPNEPQGFAGDNDVWHRHTNLCIVNGWVDHERAESRATCAGHLLAGGDLWMLHAWVVPGWENRWGNFATHNPALCPSATGTPDILRCPTG